MLLNEAHRVRPNTEHAKGVTQEIVQPPDREEDQPPGAVLLLFTIRRMLSDIPALDDAGQSRCRAIGFVIYMGCPPEGLTCYAEK